MAGDAPWPAVRALFAQLETLPPAERAAALARSGASAAVRDEVASLLAHAEAGDSQFLAAPDLPGATPPVDRAGQRLGPWALQALLGAGGMGEV